MRAVCFTVSATDGVILFIITTLLSPLIVTSVLVSGFVGTDFFGAGFTGAGFFGAGFCTGVTAIIVVLLLIIVVLLLIIVVFPGQCFICDFSQFSRRFFKSWFSSIR